MAQPFAGRAPWQPGLPDACGGIAVSCAQIDDFNLTLRASGTGFWSSDAAGPRGGGLVLGATLSFYKTAELGLSLPFAAVTSPGPPQWVYGPPAVRLRWRLGPRMGPGPFGGAWPAEEPYPKRLPAAYDVRPARGTFTLGFRFQPLWPGFSGTGPRLCRASDSSCLAEVGLSASWDVRAWRLLLTGHVEPVAAGAKGHLVVGGRAALDLFGLASLHSEALLQQGLTDPSARAGLVLVGAGLRGFRGAHLSAFYGRAFGGLSGDHLAGVQLDVPIGLLWGALARLTALVDPFLAADGWVWDDSCRPLFQLGPVRDGFVWHDAQQRWVPVGTHLWQRGGQLYEDPDGKVPFAPVVPGTGQPAPVFSSRPWPSGTLARALPAEGQAWLRRYAEAPDPSRQALCAELMAAAAAELERAAREGGTLAEVCRQYAAGAGAVAAGAQLEPPAMRWGAQLGAVLAQDIGCKSGRPGASAAPLLGLAGVLKGGGQPGAAAPAVAHGPSYLPVKNRLGQVYPSVPDLRTGQPMIFPPGTLRVVPRDQRVVWTSADRERFIREWHDRGHPRPAGGWGDYEVHHIRPRQLGGDNSFDNLTPLPKEVHYGVTEWWKAYESR